MSDRLRQRCVRLWSEEIGEKQTEAAIVHLRVVGQTVGG